MIPCFIKKMVILVETSYNISDKAFYLLLVNSKKLKFPIFINFLIINYLNTNY